MRIITFIALALALWFIGDHVTPRHGSGPFRVRNWKADVLGATFGVQQYGVYRPDEQGILSPAPMSTVIRVGPLGSIGLDTIARGSFSIFIAGAAFALSSLLLGRRRQFLSSQWFVLSDKGHVRVNLRQSESLQKDENDHGELFISLSKTRMVPRLREGTPRGDGMAGLRGLVRSAGC